MPYCPRCKYEYRTGISKCPDCDEYLVDRLPLDPEEVLVDPSDDHQDWIIVARLNSYQYAEMLVQGLRAKDIPVVVYSSTGLVAQFGGDMIKPTKDSYAIMILREYIAEADHEANLMLGEIWEKSKVIDIIE